MAQKLFTDKITTISHSVGVVSLAAGARLTIGGQQYITSSILQVSLTGLVASTLYLIYAVANSGSVSLVQSTNINSIGPAGQSAWKLVGALYTDSVAAFQSFVGQKTTAPFIRVLTGSGTYNTPLYTPWLEVDAIGGGGGGGSNAADGTSGGSTTFAGGSVSLSATGGQGGQNTSAPSPGGTATGGDDNIPGGAGNAGNNNGTTSGGKGGESTRGGGGAGGGQGSINGIAAGANTGSGGGGGGGTASRNGGGAGATARKAIQDPASSYTFACGANGVGGGAGGGAGAGGNGSAGVIIVKEGRPSLEQLETL